MHPELKADLAAALNKLQTVVARELGTIGAVPVTPGGNVDRLNQHAVMINALVDVARYLIEDLA